MGRKLDAQVEGRHGLEALQRLRDVRAEVGDLKRRDLWCRTPQQSTADSENAAAIPKGSGGKGDTEKTG